MKWRVSIVFFTLLIPFTLASCGDADNHPDQSPDPTEGQSTQVTSSLTPLPSLTFTPSTTPTTTLTPTKTITPLPTSTPVIFAGIHLTPLMEIGQGLQLSRLIQIRVPGTSGVIRFSSTRPEVFFTGAGLLVKRLNLLTNSPLPDLTGSTLSPPDRLTQSPDGQLFAGTDNNRVHIWNLETSELEHSIDVSPFWVTAIYFSDDSNTLITMDYHGNITLWDSCTWEEISSAGVPNDHMRTLFIPNQEILILDDREGNLPVVDLDGQQIGTIKLPTKSYAFVSVSPDGTRVMVHVNEGLSIFDIASGEEVRFLPLEGIRLPTVTPDWHLLAAIDSEMRLILIDLESGDNLLIQEMDFFKAKNLSLSPDGGFVGLFVIGSDKRTPYVELWGLIDESGITP